MTSAIDFYFDFSSPYAYLGSCLIETVAEKHGRKVNWHPFMLGVAMRGEKTFPLTQYPLKGEYSRMDFDRTARLYGIPFNMPDDFPKLTLAASRGFLVIAKKDPEQAIAFAKRIFTAYFVDGKDISDKDLVADISAEMGLERDQFLKDIEEADVKEAFTQSVEEIVNNRKVFGAPFFIVDGEAFWGADRVSQLDRWLEVGGW